MVLVQTEIHDQRDKILPLREMGTIQVPLNSSLFKHIATHNASVV